MKEKGQSEEDVNKIVINCPKCNQRLRVVSGRTLIVTCVSCNHDFEYPFGCEEYQSEVIDEKPLINEQKDTAAKEECSTEEEPKEESQSEEDVNKIVINCPKCNQQLRVLSGRTLVVTCVSCHHDFEYPSRCEEHRSEVVEVKPLTDEQAAQIPKRVSQNYFCKHWRGELSLAISYWVNFILIQGIATFLINWFAQSSPINHPVIAARVGIIIVIIVLFIYIWQIVGLWRSCNRHVAVYGKAFWARTVQVLVVFGLIATLVNLASYGRIYKEYYQLGFQKDTTPAYSLTLIKDDSLIHLEGGLRFGVSKDVAALLKDHPDAKGIILDCVGGRVYEGRELSKLILVYGLDTYTLKGCYSAGTMAFISGTNRFLGTGANLGFHQYSMDYENIAEIVDMEIEQEEDLRIFKRKGIKKEFLEKLYDTSAEDLWYPSIDELLSAGVIHGVVNTSDLTPVEYEESIKDINVKEILLDIPIYKTLQKYESEVFEQIITDMNEQFKKGATFLEMQETGANHIWMLASRLLPMSSDEMLIRFSQILVDMLRKLVEIDPFLCLKFVYPEQYGTFVYSKYISHEDSESLNEVLRNIIIDAHETPPPQVDIEAAELQIQEITLALGDDVEYVDIDLKKLQNSDQYKRHCDALIRIYELILAKDRKNAANMLHYMFAQDESDGGKYDGDIVDGKMQGNGIYTFSNGDKYIGEFKNDKIEGHGTIIFSSGAKHIGDFKDSKRHGQGEHFFSNGDIYVGEWENDMRNGHGTLTYSDGSKYVGEFKNENMEGQGRYTWSNGDTYVGEWENDMRNGQGTQEWFDGGKYVGEWVNDESTGLGTYTFPNDEKYVGEFKDNNAVGGWYYLTDGSREWAYTDTQGDWKFQSEADRKINGVTRKDDVGQGNELSEENSTTVYHTDEDTGGSNTELQEKEIINLSSDMHFVLQMLGEPSSKERDPKAERWNYGTSYVEFKDGVYFRCYEPYGKGDLHRKLNLK